MDIDLPTWKLAFAGVVVVVLGYLLGHLLIDALEWIHLSQEQAREGYVYVFRTLAGVLCLVILALGWMAWESRDDLRE